MNEERPWFRLSKYVSFSLSVSEYIYLIWYSEIIPTILNLSSNNFKRSDNSYVYLYP